jgi:hypothetical protein
VVKWQTRQLEVLVFREGRPGSNPGGRTLAVAEWSKAAEADG